MLQANEIVPRNPELLEGHALGTPATYEISSGGGEHSKVKKEAETNDSDEDSMREKALLVRAFGFHVVNY